MALLDKDYKAFGYNGFLEKENSIFTDFKDQQIIQKKQFDGTDQNDQEEKIEGEVFQIQSLKKSPVETREFVGKINPNLLSGGDASGKINFTGEINTKNILIGKSQVTISSNESIQHAIDRLNDVGGGTLFLKAGTYQPTTSITIPSNTHVIGISESASIIDFQNSTTNRIIVAGSDVYTTGQVVAITLRVIITGSGTEWLSNVKAGQNLFLGTKWYEIASVINDTTLVLSTQEGYADDLTLPVNYRIATTVRDVDLENIKILNCDSSSGGLDYNDARNITFRNVQSNNGAIGLSLVDCSEIATDSCFFIGNSDDGVEMNNVGLGDMEGTIASGNLVNGWDVNNNKFVTFYGCGGLANTADGMNLQSSIISIVSGTFSENSGQGLEFESSNSLCVITNTAFINNTGRGILSTATTIDSTIQGCTFTDNGSDGIELTATSDRVKIIGNSFTDNGAFGVDIANSSCDNTVILGNTFSGNVTAPINNEGTETLIRDNPGAHDTTWYATKTTDYTLTENDDVVTADASSGNITISIPTAIGISGRIFTIKKIDSGSNGVTLDPNGSEEIDDGSTAVITTQYEALTIISDGANWWII